MNGFYSYEHSQAFHSSCTLYYKINWKIGTFPLVLMLDLPPQRGWKGSLELPVLNLELKKAPQKVPQICPAFVPIQSVSRLPELWRQPHLLTAVEVWHDRAWHWLSFLAVTEIPTRVPVIKTDRRTLAPHKSVLRGPYAQRGPTNSVLQPKAVWWRRSIINVQKSVTQELFPSKNFWLLACCTQHSYVQPDGNPNLI